MPSSPFCLPVPPSLFEVLSLTSTSVPDSQLTRLLLRAEAAPIPYPFNFGWVDSPRRCPTVFTSRGSQDTLGSASTGVSLGEAGRGGDSVSARLAAAPWRSLVTSVSRSSVEGRGSFQPLKEDRTFSVAATSSSGRSPVGATSSAFAAAFLSAQPPVEADAPIFATTSSLPPSSVETVDAVETPLVVSSSEGTTIAATAAMPSLLPPPTEADDAVVTAPLVVSSLEGATIAAIAAQPSLPPPPAEANDAVTAAQPSLPPPPTEADNAVTAAQPSLLLPPTEADDAVTAPLVVSSSEGTTVSATAALHSLPPLPTEANDAVTAAQPSLPPLQTEADDAVAAPLVVSSSEETTIAAVAALPSLPPPPTEADDAVTAAPLVVSSSEGTTVAATAALHSLPPPPTEAGDAVTAAPLVVSSSEETTIAAVTALPSLPPPPVGVVDAIETSTSVLFPEGAVVAVPAALPSVPPPSVEAVDAVEASSSVLPPEGAVVAVPAALPSAPSPPAEAVVAVEASTSVLPREEAVVAVPAALPSAPSPPTEAVVAVEASTSILLREEAVVAVPAALPSAPSPPTEAVVVIEASPPISQRLLLWEESRGSTPRSVPAPIPSPSGGGVASLGDQELPSLAPRSSLPAPPRRQATISMLDGSRRSMDSMSTPLSPGRGGGRAVGPARLSGFSGRDEDPQIAITYCHLVNELLLSPTVPLSGQDPEEDAGSEPDEADGVFLESVMALERHRPRPSSRGNSGRIGLFGPVPRSSTGMELGRIPQRSWDMVPRGAVSEWFPAMPESSED